MLLILEQRRSISRRGKPTSLDHPDGFFDNLFRRDGRWKIVLGTWGRDPAKVLESEEVRAALDECLEELPTRAGDAVLLRTQQEMSIEAVAGVLEVSANNLAVILHRARTALRQCLEMKCFDSSSKE